MSADRKFNVVGTRPLRPDGADKVTGRACYGADLSLPGMLMGAVLRSPHAHARIVSIDTEAALAMTGVKAVVSGADLPTFDHTWIGVSTTGIDHWDWANNCIARDRVLYHGHAVANAVRHATGVRITDLPLSPPRVLEALETKA